MKKRKSLYLIIILAVFLLGIVFIGDIIGWWNISSLWRGFRVKKPSALPSEELQEKNKAKPFVPDILK